jgi:hypothetical protein
MKCDYFTVNKFNICRVEILRAMYMESKKDCIWRLDIKLKLSHYTPCRSLGGEEV